MRDACRLAVIATLCLAALSRPAAAAPAASSPAAAATTADTTAGTATAADTTGADTTATAMTAASTTATDPTAAGALVALVALEYAREANISAFTPFLAEEDPAVRARALLAVARVRPAGATPPLIAALGDAEPRVRRMAAYALGQAADSTASAPLLAATQDPSAPVAAEAADALARTGGPAAAPELIGLLGAREPRVRRATALGLGRLADSTRAPALITALAAETDPAAAAGILEALEKTPRRMPTAALLPSLAASSPLLRAAAAHALGKTGDSTLAAGPLIAALGDREWRVRVNAARALGELRAHSAVVALIARLDDPVHHVREAAAVALGEIGAPAAAEPLVIASADPAAGVRRAAVTAIGAVFGAGGRATLATRIEDPSPYVAAAALGAFAAVAGAEATPVLIARADPGQPSPLRIAAVTALAAAPSPERAAALRHLATDEDWVVAAIAAEALAGIDDQSAEPALVAAATRERGFEETEARVAALAALGRLGSARAAAAVRQGLADADPRVRAAAAGCADSLVARGIALDQKLLSSATTERQRQAAIKEPPLGPVPAALAPPTAPAPRRARLVTPRGAIELELFPEVAPLAVASFVQLAESGFHAGGVFHRVVPNFVAQGGCPRQDGYGGPGYALLAEPSPEEYGVGTLGMADAGPGTAGSQFFLTHSPVARLDRRYTVFGRATSGLAALEQIQLGDSFRVEILPPAEK